MQNMTTRNPVSTANLMGHPLQPISITLPIGLFVATFPFDQVFWQTGNEAFATGALWLLGVGLIGAALAAVSGIIDFLGDQRIRALGRCVATRHRQCNLGAPPTIQLLSALSLRNERARAARAEPFSCRGPHYVVHRLERRRTGVSPSRPRL
jgi:uncharacterized membrane protein